MNVDNEASIHLTPEEEAEIRALVEEVQRKFGFTVSLDATGRKRLSKAASGTEPFSNLALTVGQQHPELLPKGLPIEEMEKDLKTRKFLLEQRSSLVTLLRRVDDTIAVCGSEAFQAGLVIYRCAQNFGGDLGIEDQVAEMGKRFKRTKKTKTTTSDSTNG